MDVEWASESQNMPEPSEFSAADERSIAVPSHPLKIKPAGNAFVGEEDIKSAAGLFLNLPEELIVNILEYLGPTSLLQLGSTCKTLNAFSRLEELWKAIFIEYAFLSFQDLIHTVFLFVVEPSSTPWWKFSYP